MSETLYKKALAVKASIRTKFKAGIQGQSIVVLPALILSPISREETSTEVTAFFRKAQGMCALATLVDCPQINFPIRNRQGQLFSISMVSLSKSDRQFLSTAEKLIDLVGEKMASILESPPSQGPVNAGSGSQAHVDIERQKQEEAAESFKKDGNELFMKQLYADAVLAYSEAISLAPNTAAYYNNRAMASIKLLQFADAEQDCNKALELDGVNPKALLRRGVTRKALHRPQEAIKDFEQVWFCCKAM